MSNFLDMYETMEHVKAVSLEDAARLLIEAHVAVGKALRALQAHNWSNPGFDFVSARADREAAQVLVDEANYRVYLSSLAFVNGDPV